MKLVYPNNTVKLQCTSVKEANKLFSGDAMLARSLLARINALKNAVTIKDIVVQPAFHFHKLLNKNGNNLEGCFAIDVKSRREAWRIIIRPLDENDEPYIPCNIDEIAGRVEKVKIMEVSKHYE